MEGIRKGTSRAPSPTRVRWKWYDAIVGAIHESPVSPSNHTTIPPRIARILPPIPRVRTAPRPPCAKEAVSKADWRIVLLKSRHFPAVQIAPCRGRSFLAPTRKEPKNRLRGGASNVVYPPWAEIEAYYPDPKAPSPDNPSRRCASVKGSMVCFHRRGGYQPPVSVR